MQKERIWIPDIPPEIIRQRLKMMRPVMDFPRMGKCYIETGLAVSGNFLKDAKVVRKAVEIKALCDIRTYHRHGADPDTLEASIREVLSQIPEKGYVNVIAFQVLTEDWSVDELFEFDAWRAGYHAATTRLYVPVSIVPSSH